MSDIELTLVLHRDAPADDAILVSETGDPARTKWLPRRKITYAHTGQFHQVRVGADKLAVITATVPEWLAKDRGFV